MQNDDICNLWQAQGAGPAPLTLEEIRMRAGKFQSQISRRNIREYAVSVLLLFYFGYFGWTSRVPLMRAGNALMMAGLLYMMYQLFRKTSVTSAPGDLGWKSCVAFHRAELERQREALQDIWKWYLGPMLPGLLTFAVAGCIGGFRFSWWAGTAVVLVSGAIGLGFWWLGRLNQAAADEIRRQMEALDAAAS